MALLSRSGDAVENSPARLRASTGRMEPLERLQHQVCCSQQKSGRESFSTASTRWRLSAIASAVVRWGSAA